MVKLIKTFDYNLFSFEGKGIVREIPTDHPDTYPEISLTIFTRFTLH